MNWKSLRTQLTVSSALLIFLAATIAATGTIWHTWHEQVEHLDDSLKRQSRTIQHLLTRSKNPAQVKALIQLGPSVEADLRSIRVWNAQGKLIITVGRHRDGWPQQPGGDGFRTESINQREARLATFTTDGFRIELGADLAHINETIMDLVPAYSIILPLLLLLTIVGGSWLAGRALQPITQLVKQAETITATELDRPLPIITPDDEIGRLTKVLNAMLARLRISFEQTRRFSADASHELKTPLTILRGQLEATLYPPHSPHSPAAPKSPEALQDTLLAALGEVDRLSRIIDGLLLLSCSDAGQLGIELRRLDFSRFIRSLLEDAEVLASGKELSIEAAIADSLWVQADEAYLRQVVLNLLDNACKYNHPRGKLKVAAQRTADGVELSISNTGPGIPAQQAERLFERFSRGDAAHGQQVDGLGLGLAIAQEIARAHGSQIQLIVHDADWTTFSLTLPASAEPAE